VELLKVGRHFRLSNNVKLIVGRNEEENEIITGLALVNDLLLESIPFKGPVGMIRGSNLGPVLETAAAVVNRYSDAPRGCASPVRVYMGTQDLQTINSIPCDDSLPDMLRI
jgi:predicted ribosome quality control (RQC) complex YloA/Tae2 family protein